MTQRVKSRKGHKLCGVGNCRNPEVFGVGLCQVHLSKAMDFVDTFLKLIKTVPSNIPGLRDFLTVPDEEPYRGWVVSFHSVLEVGRQEEWASLQGFFVHGFVTRRKTLLPPGQRMHAHMRFVERVVVVDVDPVEPSCACALHFREHVR